MDYVLLLALFLPFQFPPRSFGPEDRLLVASVLAFILVVGLACSDAGSVPSPVTSVSTRMPSPTSTTIPPLTTIPPQAAALEPSPAPTQSPPPIADPEPSGTPADPPVINVTATPNAATTAPSEATPTPSLTPTATQTQVPPTTMRVVPSALGFMSVYESEEYLFSIQFPRRWPRSSPQLGIDSVASFADPEGGSLSIVEENASDLGLDETLTVESPSHQRITTYGSLTAAATTFPDWTTQAASYRW